MSAPVIELSLICLPVISADVVATAVPARATNSAIIATIIAGDWRTRSASSFFTGSPFRPLEGIEQVPLGGSVRRRLPDSYRPTGLSRRVAGPGFTADDPAREPRRETLATVWGA